jgi:hypothetical protein
MIQSLRPGGWLLLEEPDQSLVMGRSIPDEPAIARFAQGMRAITERGGGDANFGLRVADFARKHRLQEIEVHVRLPEVTADVVSMLEAGGEALVSMGYLEPGDIERITDFMSDPANVMFGPMIIATSARKPG